MRETQRMSREITVSASLSAQKGGLDVEEGIKKLFLDMDGSHSFSQVFDLSPDGTDIHLEVPSTIAVQGWGWFVNLSDTADVEISTATGAGFNDHLWTQLQPGEIAFLPLAPFANYYAKSTSEYGAEHQVKLTVLER